MEIQRETESQGCRRLAGNRSPHFSSEGWSHPSGAGAQHRGESDSVGDLSVSVAMGEKERTTRCTSNGACAFAFGGPITWRQATLGLWSRVLQRNRGGGNVRFRVPRRPSGPKELPSSFLLHGPETLV